MIIPPSPIGRCSTTSVAASTTVSREWNTGPIINSESTLIISKTKNGVSSKEKVSGTLFLKYFSNFEPIIPVKNAGKTVP